MNSNSWVDPRIDQVTVADVKQYLSLEGWVLRSDSGPDLLLFEGPPDDNGKPVLQVLPSSESKLDFRLRVEELIGALSILEDRPAQEVLDSVLKSGETQVEGEESKAPSPSATEKKPL